MKEATSKIRIKVLQWNNRFPLDSWWRRKYNIPFGSKEHFETDLFKMRFDYEEERMFRLKAVARIMKLGLSEVLEILDEKIANAAHSTINDTEFEEIDLEQFNDKENGSKS